MKKAISLLLGDHFNASEIEYGDCEEFQLICPACSEPVFKVERLIKNGDDITEYFSHYGKGDSTSCNLRVASMTNKELNQKISISRGQSLQKFQHILKRYVENGLRELVNKSEDDIPFPEFKKQIIKRTKFKGVETLSIAFSGVFQKTKNKQTLYKCILEAINSQSINTKYAYDYLTILKYLATPKGYSTLLFFMSVSFDITTFDGVPSIIRTTLQDIENDPESDGRMADYIVVLFNSIINRDIKSYERTIMKINNETQFNAAEMLPLHTFGGTLHSLIFIIDTLLDLDKIRQEVNLSKIA